MVLLMAGSPTSNYDYRWKDSFLKESVLSPGMHALKISFDSKDSISHTWSLYEKGEKKSDVVIKLSRTKS